MIPNNHNNNNNNNNNLKNSNQYINQAQNIQTNAQINRYQMEHNQGFHSIIIYNHNISYLYK